MVKMDRVGRSLAAGAKTPFSDAGTRDCREPITNEGDVELNGGRTVLGRSARGIRIQSGFTLNWTGGDI